MKRTINMTKGSITKQILAFAFPLILANIGQQLYMIADASIVGLGLGVKALAAVGATDWCYWLILWTVIGLTQAFSTFISRYFGKGDFDEMNKVIVTSALLTFIVSAILTVLGLIVSKPLLLLLKTPADIIDNAQIYLMTMVSGTIVVAAYNMSGSVLRAFGDGKSPLIAMIIAAVVNIGLDALFVLIFKWGVFGAAFASVLAQLISFIYCMAMIWKIEFIKFDRVKSKPDFKTVKEMMVFGTPIALLYIVLSVGGIVLQSTINIQGSVFVAGYTATNKLYGLLEATAIAIGMAFSTFFSQNYGARNMQRIKSGMKQAVLMCVILGAIEAGLVFVFGKYMLRVFLDVGESGGMEALLVGYRYLVIMSAFLVILYLIHVFRNVLQALEISLWSMLSGFAECAVRVLMAKVFINFIGTDALFYAEPLAWLGALLLVALPYIYYDRKLLK